jgi:hypothetical protein
VPYISRKLRRTYIPSNEYGTNWISDLSQTTKKIIQEGLQQTLLDWGSGATFYES